jgi:hypothetical protein
VPKVSRPGVRRVTGGRRRDTYSKASVGKRGSCSCALARAAHQEQRLPVTCSKSRTWLTGQRPTQRSFMFQ